MSRPIPFNHIIIQTPRLLLRPMTLEDAGDIFLLRSDPETVRYTPIQPDKTVEQTREWIRTVLTTGKDLFFAIEVRNRITTHLKDSTKNRLHSVNRVPQTSDDPFPKAIGFLTASKLPEIGYGLNRNYWNHGYMTEVLKGFVTAYWDLYPEGYPGLEGNERNCLVAQTFQANLASQAVLKKCGFEWWKEEQQEVKGEKMIAVWYRLWRPEQGEARSEGFSWRCSVDRDGGGLLRNATVAKEKTCYDVERFENAEKKGNWGEAASKDDDLWVKVREKFSYYLGCLY